MVHTAKIVQAPHTEREQGALRVYLLQKKEKLQSFLDYLQGYL